MSTLGGSVLEAYAPPWPNWVWDEDMNEVHDALDERFANGYQGNSTAAFFFSVPPSTDELNELRQRLENSTFFVPLDAIPAVLANAITSKVIDAASSSGVIAVDFLDYAVEAALDVSTRAIKVRSSSEYSPSTVREAFGADGTGMLIAVVDSGVDDHRHESLTNKYYVGGWWTKDPITGAETSVPCTNPVDRDTGPPGSPPDWGYHGTGVAGAALGTGGASGTYQGVAPGARLADLRITTVLNQPHLDAVVRAFQWAIGWNEQVNTCPGISFDPIDVIVLSRGTIDDCGQGSLSSLIIRAFQSGIATVHAAGNRGDAAETIDGPSTEGGTIHVGAVSDYNTISRTDDKSRQSSSRGYCCDDGDAESNDEKLPIVGAPGTSIVVPTPTNDVGDECSTCYKARSGTSFATPEVAGVVASMLQVRPCLKPTSLGDSRVRDILINTSEYRTEVEGLAPQHSGTGYFGRSWNNVWGYGYVDAYEAVRRANDASC